MRFVTVRELEANPPQFLRLAAKRRTVVVASHGKLTAFLRAITEDEIEGDVPENSPRIKRMVAEGERDRRAGRVTPRERDIARLRSRVARLRGGPHASGARRPRRVPLEGPAPDRPGDCLPGA